MCDPRTICRPKRREELLGRHSNPNEKRLRAFTIQAEQEIWDIGCPIIKRHYKGLHPSKFRKHLKEAKYDFVTDHSAAGEFRLSWKCELQEQDFQDLIPDLLLAFVENDIMMYRIAKTAFVDLMKHGPLDRLIDAIPVMTQTMKTVLAYNNEVILGRVIEAIRTITTVQKRMVPTLVHYIEGVLQYLNHYIENRKGCHDQILYKRDLVDTIQYMLMDLVENAGAEKEFANRAVKRAIPTFQTQ